MKTDQEYINDLSEIRSMMERSSKFLTLTGWPGILAGIYALMGVLVAYRTLLPNTLVLSSDTLYLQDIQVEVYKGVLIALVVLALSLGTAIFIPYRKAQQMGERVWNTAARRMVINMAFPLVAGGIFILIIFAKGILGLIAPLMLIFYGLALLSASKYTYEEVKYLGITEVVLGLLAAYFFEFGLLFWALGFGLMHIVYGIYMHLKYEK